jgi:hypothetical protein
MRETSGDPMVARKSAVTEVANVGLIRALGVSLLLVGLALAVTYVTAGLV